MEGLLLMTTCTARTPRPRSRCPPASPRPGGLARVALSAHLVRSVFAVAAERRITDPDLIQQTIDACYAAIGLVLLTDYHRTGLVDHEKVTDPEATAAAVRAALSRHPRELRPDLVRRAAVKIAIARVAD